MRLQWPKRKDIGLSLSWRDDIDAQAITAAEDLEKVKARAYDDYGFFIRYFFGGDKPGDGHFWGEFSPVHEDVIALEKKPDRRGVLEATAAPRGNAKTVFRVLAKVIHSIVYGYHPFTVVIGYSAQEAEGKIKDIRDELLHNEKLIKVYGQLLHKGAGTQGFVAKNNCMVLARGRGGQVRGLRHGRFRPTHIICDDVEDLEAVQSPLQRQKTKDWLTKDVMPAIQSGDAYKGSITFVGTVLHEESLLADLLKDSSWKRQKYKAVISRAKNEHLWEEWRAIYNELDNENALEDAKAFYLANEAAMLEGTEVLWPDGEPYYELMGQEIKMGKAAFASEKQNEPFDPDRQILDPDQCPRFHVYTPKDEEWLDSLGQEGFAIVRSDNGKAVHSRDLTLVAFLDPAVGKDKKNQKLAKKDFAAIVICGQDPSGYVYLLEVWLKKLAPDKQVKAAYELAQKWGVDTLHLETVGFQELLKDHFKVEQKNWAHQLRVVGVDQYSNKQARITALQPYFANKWLLMADNTDADFLGQLRQFPTADHDDGPDALEGAVRRLRKPRGEMITHQRQQGVV